jgi:hypothetical protein
LLLLRNEAEKEADALLQAEKAKDALLQAEKAKDALLQAAQQQRPRKRNWLDILVSIASAVLPFLVLLL